MTPDAAIKELVAGNQRFASNQLTSIQHDLELLKNRPAEKQEPFAIADRNTSASQERPARSDVERV